ncbi:small-conductance mechanosensitive channel [Spirosoma pulveris]
MKKKTLLIISFLFFFILPFLGSYLKWGGLPPGYGLFPAQKVADDPPFNQTYFNFCSLVALFILTFLLLPKLFGFKKKPNDDEAEKVSVSYPVWFRPAIVVVLVSWLLMWGRFDALKPVDNFTFVPLWWGFIFVLDGIVYKRNNGVSLISAKPNTVKILAVTSAFSWFVFEYQNFFVLENWYYPNNNILSNFGNISWQLVSYTTVLPAIFEWYWLLRTFKSIKNRYSFGPAIRFSTTGQYICLFIGGISLFLMGYFPNELFWMLWVSMLPLLVPAMAISGFWTPFTEISKKGDWSFVVLIAISTLLNGFFWEFWNFGSEWFHDDIPTNPNYWKYSVPYLDKYHLFSEMPILGYFGYLLFGNACWLLWVIVARLVGFDASVDVNQVSEKKVAQVN